VATKKRTDPADSPVATQRQGKRRFARDSDRYRDTKMYRESTKRFKADVEERVEQRKQQFAERTAKREASRKAREDKSPVRTQAYLMEMAKQTEIENLASLEFWKQAEERAREERSKRFSKKHAVAGPLLRTRSFTQRQGEVTVAVTQLAFVNGAEFEFSKSSRPGRFILSRCVHSAHQY
jgi:hypothetical protein